MEPTFYIVSKTKGEKIGMSFRLTHNNFNKFFYQKIAYNSSSSTDDYVYTHHMFKSQSVISKTFLVNYEKHLRNPRWFMQFQMGFTILKNLSAVQEKIDPYRIPPYKYNNINDNYFVDFDPFIFNLTFGVNLGARKTSHPNPKNNISVEEMLK